MLIAIATDEVLSLRPNVAINALVRAAAECRLEIRCSTGVPDLVVRILGKLGPSSSFGEARMGG